MSKKEEKFMYDEPSYDVFEEIANTISLNPDPNAVPLLQTPTEIELEEIKKARFFQAMSNNAYGTTYGQPFSKKRREYWEQFNILQDEFN